MKRGTRRTSRVLAAATVVGWLITGCAGGDLVTEETALAPPAGRHVVLLLDASTSMRENDPGRAADTGVSLALSLLGRQDGVAVISYARDAEVQVPLQAAGDGARRDRMRDALADVERNGITNFPGALRRARQVLEAGRSPPGSVLVLLTDGIPYEERGRGQRVIVGTVAEEVEAIAARGWRIFAVALGQEAATPLLAEMVGKTRGAVFPARDADELVEAFQEVALEALGYLESERGAQAISVAPRTKRLAVVGRWPGAGGRPGALSHDGQPVDEARLVRSPSTAPAPLAAALVEDPEPGVWSCELSGARDALLFLEPSFGVELEPEAPPAQVASAKPFPVAVRLVGAEQVLADVLPRVSLRVRLQTEGSWASAWQPLTPDPAEPRRFTRRLVAPRTAKDARLRVVVELELSGEQRPFALKRSRSLTVLAPAGAAPAPERLPPLQLSVEPPRVERVAWADEPGLEPVVLSVRGDPQRVATLQAPGQDPLSLGPGERVELELPCPPQGGRLDLRAEADGAAGWRAAVPVQVTRYSLQGPGRTLRLPAAPAGLVVERPHGLSLSPQAELWLEAELLRGPGPGIPLEIVEGGLRAELPADAAPGHYRGRLLVGTRERPGLTRREVEVLLEVQPPYAPPGQARLTGGWGWISGPVEVSWPSLEAVPVEVTPGPLLLRGEDARIDPQLDVRWQPLEGWDGQHLSVESRRLALQVYVSSDLPGGVYEGALELKGPGRDPLTVPVRLEVQR